MTKVARAVAGLMCMTLGTTAMAQPGEGGGRGWGGGRMLSSAMLLRQEPVQAELGLSGDQKERLAGLADGGLRDEGGRNPREMTQEERREWMAQLQERMSKLDDNVREILTPDQLTRLREIRVQAMGPNVAADPDLAKQIGITDAQQEKLAGLRQKMREARGEGGPAGLREKMENAFTDMLTPEQKAKLESLRGKPFDLSSLQLGGRGGRRRGAE
jgi:hypothetical protein